ncbi:hypothetical protein FKW78_25845 [Mycolicibacterium fortuitum]|nr:hypothetical protein FKW78_25845 [Mycolicibacterium fortuitum]
MTASIGISSAQGWSSGSWEYARSGPTAAESACAGAICVASAAGAIGAICVASEAGAIWVASEAAGAIWVGSCGTPTTGAI